MELKATVKNQTLHRDGGKLVLEKQVAGTVTETLPATRKRQKGSDIVPAAALRDRERQHAIRIKAIDAKANEACDKLTRRIAELKKK